MAAIELNTIAFRLENAEAMEEEEEVEVEEVGVVMNEQMNSDEASSKRNILVTERPNLNSNILAQIVYPNFENSF